MSGIVYSSPQKPNHNRFPEMLLFIHFFIAIFFFFLIWCLWDHTLKISRSPCPHPHLFSHHWTWLNSFRDLSKGPYNLSLDFIVLLGPHFTLKIFCQLGSLQMRKILFSNLATLSFTIFPLKLTCKWTSTFLVHSLLIYLKCSKTNWHSEYITWKIILPRSINSLGIL